MLHGGLAWKRATLARDAEGHLAVMAVPMSVSSRKCSGTHWMNSKRECRWAGKWARTTAAGKTSSRTPTAKGLVMWARRKSSTAVPVAQQYSTAMRNHSRSHGVRRV